MAPKNDVPAYVLGVGLTKFIKPRQQRAYPEMGYEAGVKAMLDAQINYDDVETGVATAMAIPQVGRGSSINLA
jgi:sterol carrier protein 2